MSSLISLHTRFTLFLFAAGMVLPANDGFGQIPGAVFFNNRYISGVGAPIVAPIYGPEPGAPSLALRGSGITNGGSQVYTGPLLTGTGYTAALYGGPAVITDENDPKLLHFGPTVTFRTTSSTAGFFIAPTAPVFISNVTVGDFATFQVRAWDNRGGTIASWSEVLSDPTVPRGSSALFSPIFPLANPNFPNMSPPGLAGLESFNLFIPIPEPSSIALIGLAVAIALLVCRRAKLAVQLVCIGGLTVTSDTFAQGTVFFNNRYVSGIGAPIVAPIYGPEAGNPSLALRGNATTNGGSQFYTGPLLVGTGYTAALYGGPAVITDENDPQLLFLASRTFLTNATAAGFIQPTSSAVTVPNVAFGAFATFQVRAWDNRDGTITSWAQALADPAIARGSSALFTPPFPLGDCCQGPSGPGLATLQSFNLVVPIPEPSAFALLAVVATLGLSIHGYRAARWR